MTNEFDSGSKNLYRSLMKQFSGKKLREIRTLKGITRADLVEKLNVYYPKITRGHIHYWEKFEVVNIGANSLYALAKVLNVSVMKFAVEK